MSKNPSLIIGASIILGCLMLGLSSSHPAAGQSAVPPQGEKLQIVVSQPHIGSDCTVIVFDPVSGHAWQRSSNPSITTWRSLGSPIVKTDK